MTEGELSARFEAHPSMVLAAYVEPLARARRVAVFGDATVGLAERLMERGARLVHAYDPDAARSAEALARIGLPRPSNLHHAPLSGDLGVRDGAFDLVIVPDLSLFPDPAELLRRARRLLGPSGAAVLASPNPAVERRVVAAPEAGKALGYYDIYELCAVEFSVVRMVGQAPFVGYAVADFAQEDEEPEVSVDTSLLEASEEPEWFLAVASERPVKLEPFTVIEVPFAQTGGEAPSSREPHTQPRPARSVSEADARASEAESRLALANAELTKLRERQRQEAGDVEQRSRTASGLTTRVAVLEAELERRTIRLSEIEGKLGDDHVRAERLGHDVRDLEEQLRQQRDRAAKLAKQLDDEKKARQKADVELGMIRTKPELAGAKDRLDALAADLDRARARVAELEAAPPRRDPALVARVAELEAGMRDAQREVADLAGQRDLAEGRATEIDEARDEVVARLTALLDEKNRADREDDAAELLAMEAALVERGRVVARLTSDLRESERIGRELVAELETASNGAPLATNGALANAGSGAADTGARAAAELEIAGLRGRLEALATGAAKCQADLQAASWRIAELERRLSDAESARPEEVANAELEEALRAAHDEIAALRAAHDEAAARADAPRAVAEDAVLLHQTAGPRT